MRLLCCVTAAILLTANLSARADNVGTFDVSGTFTDSTTISGTVVIDTTTGVLESGDLSYLGMSFDVLNAVQQQQEGYVFILSASSALFPLLDFVIAADSLVGFNGGPLCSTSDLCPANGFNVVSGYAAVDLNNPIRLRTGMVSPTPEPSTVALLGTGLLGLAVVRRRFVV